MSLWEYKVITSGKGGFATPALLEKFLNDLGRDEWEIVEFRSSPDNALAFTGLARRSTQRDWTLEDAAAAAAKVEAEKLRAEFAAKFQAASSNTPAVEEKTASFLEEKSAPDDGFRSPVDTSRDSDPDAPEEETAEKDEWDQLAAEDELPSFFDALKPHMRRNQRGPGMSVGTDYLAKKWGLAEEDIKGALVECGMQIPADENAKPAYVEYDGDLYWVNINRRGEVWINTREKPRPVFRVVQATKLAPEAIEETKPENGNQKTETARPPRGETAAQPAEVARSEKTETTAPSSESGTGEPASQNGEAKNRRRDGGSAAGAPLPQGPALLEKIRPLMRRNRRGPGGSGSGSFLARALKCSEADLLAGFASLGLVLPATPTDKPVEVEINGDIWWLNQDSRGGLWINGREKRGGEKAAAAAVTDSATSTSPTGEAPNPADVPAVAEGAAAQPSETAKEQTPELSPENSTTAEANAPAPVVADSPSAVASSPTSTGEATGVLAAVRLLLKETKTGSFAGKIDRVADEIGKSPDDLTAALVGAGLKVPEKPREKPVFVEHAGEIFWFNRNAKGELWVNAKASKFSDPSEGEAETSSDEHRKGTRRSGGRTKKSADPAG